MQKKYYNRKKGTRIPGGARLLAFSRWAANGRNIRGVKMTFYMHIRGVALGGV